MQQAAKRLKVTSGLESDEEEGAKKKGGGKRADEIEIGEAYERSRNQQARVKAVRKPRLYEATL